MGQREPGKRRPGYQRLADERIAYTAVFLARFRVTLDEIRTMPRPVWVALQEIIDAERGR